MLRHEACSRVYNPSWVHATRVVTSAGELGTMSKNNLRGITKAEMEDQLSYTPHILLVSRCTRDWNNLVCFESDHYKFKTSHKLTASLCNVISQWLCACDNIFCRLDSQPFWESSYGPSPKRTCCRARYVGSQNGWKSSIHLLLNWFFFF